MRSNRWAFVASVAVFTAVAAACGADDGGSRGGAPGNEGLTGSITISGSSTVEPISALVAELFNETSPDVAIGVDGPGTGDGFELFCSGETDISDASRPIEPDEADTCASHGIEYIELEVAVDGITVMTNPENPIDCLTTGDLYALFGPESEAFTSWSDANALASEVGGAGGLPDAPLEISAPGEESGTYDAFIELAGIESTALERGVSEDDAATLRKDYHSSPNDNVIIQAMEGTPSALGFVGYAYAEQAGEQIKEIEVDGGDGCVAPAAETIADASYPLSRSLFIYVNSAKVADSEALRAFVDYYVSDEVLGDVVEQVGYVPLPADRVETTRQTWQEGSA